MLNYYLYKHIRPDREEVFYVGIGTKRRYKDSEYYSRAFVSYNRNKIWRSIVEKNNGIFKVEIIMESDDTEFIKKKEIETIRTYGRIDLKTGTLANLTDGGDGQLFRQIAEETRQKTSAFHKGRKRTGKALNNIRIGLEKNRYRIKIIDTSNGHVYESIEQAHIKTGIPKTTLFQYVHNKRKNKTTLKLL